ncbi:hypothetical protein [Rufibacter hautae]|uniref:Uncharacterized protein n=1 Tax=Rufibacter hautae TaxID=2595005 RepID=A0A5B6T9L7_9BACT|nr:hypothetical protein [Rufibacter hautae]KAA3436896.1 hypothetical protein FOA19_21210 [Rufibacter hautae]
MTILHRIFKIGTSEAHPSVEGLKEPIQRTEQGIRDMRLELEKNVRALEAFSNSEENGGVAPDSQASGQSRAELEQKIKALKTNLRKWEMQLRVLQSRVTVSSATKTINRQMAQLNAPGSLTLLENRPAEGPADQQQVQNPEETASQTLGQQNASQEPQDACTPQTFAQKADALNEKLSLTPTASAPDAPTTQP